MGNCAPMINQSKSGAGNRRSCWEGLYSCKLTCRRVRPRYIKVCIKMNVATHGGDVGTQPFLPNRGIVAHLARTSTVYVGNMWNSNDRIYSTQHLPTRLFGAACTRRPPPHTAKSPKTRAYAPALASTPFTTHKLPPAFYPLRRSDQPSGTNTDPRRLRKPKHCASTHSLERQRALHCGPSRLRRIPPSRSHIYQDPRLSTRTSDNTRACQGTCEDGRAAVVVALACCTGSSRGERGLCAESPPQGMNDPRAWIHRA
jgi:hypothetical protein